MILNIDVNVVEVIQRRRLVYYGHIVSMVYDCYPIHGCVSGLRPEGRPRKKWLDNIQDEYAVLGLYVPDADRLGRDRRLGNLLCASCIMLSSRDDYIVIWTSKKEGETVVRKTNDSE